MVPVAFCPVLLGRDCVRHQVGGCSFRMVVCCFQGCFCACTCLDLKFTPHTRGREVTLFSFSFLAFPALSRTDNSDGKENPTGRRGVRHCDSDYGAQAAGLLYLALCHWRACQQQALRNPRSILERVSGDGRSPDETQLINILKKRVQHTTNTFHMSRSATIGLFYRDLGAGWLHDDTRWRP